jgi:hypothetical protein
VDTQTKDSLNPPQRPWYFGKPSSPLILWAQWLLIPAVLLLGLEFKFKSWVVKRETGYIEAAARPPAQPVNAVFIGVSRTEAAIDTDAFDTRVRDISGHEFHSMNLGHPSRTLAVHYYGLKKLFGKYPNLFKGCTVLLEAPFGLPESRKWTDNWSDPGYEKLLVPLLTKADYNRMLESSVLTSDDRMNYRSLWYEQKSSLIYYRKLIRKQLVTKYDHQFLRLFRKIHSVSNPANGRKLDIKSDGSIRIDEDAAAVGLEKAKSWLKGDGKMPQPVGDWHTTILNDLNSLVEANGGRLVFFQMPMNSVFALGYNNPIKDQDRQTFNDAMKSWKSQILTAKDFTYTDEDFPDTWHLSKQRSSEFSSRLADSYLSANLASH